MKLPTKRRTTVTWRVLSDDNVRTRVSQWRTGTPDPWALLPHSEKMKTIRIYFQGIEIGTIKRNKFKQYSYILYANKVKVKLA